MTLKYGSTTYTVTKRDDGSHCAYELHGPRGARYGLMRNVHTPEAMFLVNLRKFTGSVPFEWALETENGIEVQR